MEIDEPEEEYVIIIMNINVLNQDESATEPITVQMENGLNESDFYPGNSFRDNYGMLYYRDLNFGETGSVYCYAIFNVDFEQCKYLIYESSRGDIHYSIK